jgi:hypothetical protein
MAHDLGEPMQGNRGCHAIPEAVTYIMRAGVDEARLGGVPLDHVAQAPFGEGLSRLVGGKEKDTADGQRREIPPIDDVWGAC